MKNKKTKLVIAIVIGIVILGVDFYAGVLTGKTKKMPGALNQQKGMQTSKFTNRQNDFLMGEIMSKDDKSITLKLANGGSRVILFSDSTEVGKFVTGSIADMEIGKSVIANGKTNQDGSITAQSIQIRPDKNLPGQPGEVPPQNPEPKL